MNTERFENFFKVLAETPQEVVDSVKGWMSMKDITQDCVVPVFGPNYFHCYKGVYYRWVPQPTYLYTWTKWGIWDLNDSQDLESPNRMMFFGETSNIYDMRIDECINYFLTGWYPPRMMDWGHMPNFFSETFNIKI